MSEFHHFQRIIIKAHEQNSKHLLTILNEDREREKPTVPKRVNTSISNETCISRDQSIAAKKPKLVMDCSKYSTPRDPSLQIVKTEDQQVSVGDFTISFVSEDPCTSKVSCNDESNNVSVELLSSDESYTADAGNDPEWNDEANDGYVGEVAETPNKSPPAEAFNGFKCSICYESFSKLSFLRLHTNKEHPDEECQIICCQHFHVGSEQIEKHIKFHLEKIRKSTECDLCQKSFKTRHHLNTHRKRAHLNDTLNMLSSWQRAKCRFCDKIYVRKDDLEEHEANHMGVALYKCLVCSGSIQYRSSIYRHFRAKHPVEWNERKTSKNPRYIKLNLKDVVNVALDLK